MSTLLTVLHTCGHEGKHAVGGSELERQQREAWLRRQPCQACWRAAQQREATDQGSALGLPPLVGSPEDIAWAEVLRAKAIAHNKTYHDQLHAEKPFEDTPAIQEAVLRAASNALNELMKECHAIWWIENRFETLHFVKEQAAAALAALNSPKDQ